MSKIKSKLFDKLFLQKDNLSNNSDYENLSNMTYFSNVVPPIKNNSEFDQNLENQSYDNNKSIQITNSYIVPVAKDTRIDNTQSFINQKHTYYEQPAIIDTMSLISFKNSFKIPKPISWEIKAEKLKHLILFFVSFAVLVITTTFSGLYISNINIKFIPHPVLTIPLAIIALVIALINIIEFISLKKEVELYIERTLKGSLLPPNFIIRNYRKIHTNLIILNWISINCYVVLIISIGIMFLISSQKLTFIIQSWTVTIPNIIKDAFTLVIVLGIIFIIHMINIVLFKFRKRNIISYYGYEIINIQELNQYKKKINRICMLITIGFVSLIFFAIVIPIWVFKKRKKK